jgi:hypothetical protein
VETSSRWPRGAVLTFAKASLLYKAAGKQMRYLPKIEDYWKDTLVRT